MHGRQAACAGRGGDFALYYTNTRPRSTSTSTSTCLRPSTCVDRFAVANASITRLRRLGTGDGVHIAIRRSRTLRVPVDFHLDTDVVERGVANGRTRLTGDDALPCYHGR